MAVTHYYVDPLNGNDGNAGTSDGAAWKTMSHAFATVGSTTWAQINLKDSAADVLTATLSGASWPDSNNLLTVRGYTSTPNDGGIGEIDGNGAYGLLSMKGVFLDLKIGNTGSANLFHFHYQAEASGVVNCELYGSTGYGIQIGSQCECIHVVGNNIYDIGGEGITCSSSGLGSLISGNYLKNGPTNSFTNAIRTYKYVTVSRNIISIDGSSNGIVMQNGSGGHGAIINNNTIYSPSGTGQGISDGWDIHNAESTYNNNLVSGFDGAGGIGIRGITDSRVMFASGNAVYGATTEYVDLDSGDFNGTNIDNESLTSQPLALEGDDTFANRFTYFAPKDVGNVWGGSIGSNLDKGAVQRGAQSGARHPLARF